MLDHIGTTLTKDEPTCDEGKVDEVGKGRFADDD